MGPWGRVKSAVRGALQSVAGAVRPRMWWPMVRESRPGAWQENVTVDTPTGLTNPTLYACVTLIAGDIAKLRPMLVEQDQHGIWEEIDDLLPYAAVLETPNTYQDWIDFCEWWQLSKLIHGNTYALKARDGRGLVRALHILDPLRVEPLVGPDGSIFYAIATDRLAELPPEGLVVPAREIIHDLMCPLFHPLCGVSPLYAAGAPALHGIEIRNASGRFFGNGSRPGGILTAPGQMKKERMLELKTYFETEFSGDNTGKIAVVSDGLKYEPLAMTAEQSQLIDQLKMTDEDICKAFHMPRHKVGVGPDPTYNNIGALNQQYYTDCLQKHIAKLQRKLTTGIGLSIVPGRTVAVELDLDDLQLMDSTSRIEAGTKAITGGMAPNEVRARYFDLGPVRGGEEPYLQRQNWPLHLLGTDQPPARGPEPPALEPPPADELPPAELAKAAAGALRAALEGAA